MDFLFNNFFNFSLNIILIILLLITASKILSLKQKINLLIFQRQSQSTKFGKMTEQLLPLLDVYPWDSTNFRFIGSPIDGIQFEEDCIILVEFKTGSSQLSKKQKSIKKLVEEKKVFFEEVRISS